MLTSLWTELSELEIWSPFTLFLRVICSKASYTLADLVTQHLSSSTLPEFHAGLTLSSLASALRIQCLPWAKRNSSESDSSNLFDRKSGHSQLPNLHSLFLTPTLFFIIWSKIFSSEYLNSVLTHGNSVSCVDMSLRNYSSPTITHHFPCKDSLSATQTMWQFFHQGGQVSVI